MKTFFKIIINHQRFYKSKKADLTTEILDNGAWCRKSLNLTDISAKRIKTCDLH